MSVISADWNDTVSIPTAEYEALTSLESHVRKLAAKRTYVNRQTLSMFLEQIRFSRRP